MIPDHSTPDPDHFADQPDECRFVAFIDILGFRNLLLRSPNLVEFWQKYTSVFKPLENEIQTLGIKHTLFSDSLFLSVENRSPDEQLKSLLRFSRRLLGRSIASKLPIRGAISYGRVLWRGDVVVGIPIIEAVDYEKMQDWIGIMLAPSSISYLFDNEELIDDLLADGLITKYEDVPVVRSSECISGYVVDLLSRNKEEADDEAKDIVSSLEAIGLYACSVEAERKYRETKKYIEAQLRKRKLSEGSKKSSSRPFLGA